MSATAVEGEWANQCINAKLTYLQYITLICKLGDKKGQGSTIGKTLLTQLLLYM